MTRQSVMKKIEKDNETYIVKINGTEKDKDDAFHILINTQQVVSDTKGVYYGIKNSTIKLLKDAEIDFQIVK